VLGGVVLLFVDNWFKNPTILDEKDISIKQLPLVLAMSSNDARNIALGSFHNG
jgi:hypothetical protein